MWDTCIRISRKQVREGWKGAPQQRPKNKIWAKSCRGVGTNPWRNNWGTQDVKGC